MKFPVEVFRGQEQQATERLDLMAFVRGALLGFLKTQFDHVTLRVTIHPIHAESTTFGKPVVRYLQPDFGYCYVKLMYGDRVVYQHPHTIQEMIGVPLQQYLRTKYPDELEWTYRIDVVGLPKFNSFASRPTPVVEGATLVTPYQAGEQAGFQIRRIPELPPPLKRLSDFGVTPDDSQRAAIVKVVLPRNLYDDLCGSRPLSLDFEEGGFLIGRIYQDADCEGCYIAELTSAPNAEHTGASFLQFTFTGDSFAAVKRIIREQHPSERMLGWYHTHLFPATDTMGLSSIDLTLHFSTFTIPWQLAGLINIDKGLRTLRFYVRQQADMVLCPFWSIP